MNENSSKAENTSVPNNLIPAGVIVLWSGNDSNVPKGWALCDGTGGTPNLSQRFVLGAGSANGTTVAPGFTGGASTVSLDHTHSLQSLFGQNTDSKGEGYSHVAIQDENWQTTTDASFTNTPDNSATISLLPPYYALYYIIKL